MTHGWPDSEGAAARPAGREKGECRPDKPSGRRTTSPESHIAGAQVKPGKRIITVGSALLDIDTAICGQWRAEDRAAQVGTRTGGQGSGRCAWRTSSM